MTRRRFTAQHGAYNALQPLSCHRRMQARATQSPRSMPHVGAYKSLVAVNATCRRTQSTRRGHRPMPARKELVVVIASCRHSQITHRGHRLMSAHTEHSSVIAACRRTQITRRGHRHIPAQAEHSSLLSPMQARRALVCHRRMQARRALVAVIVACRRSQSIRRGHRRMSTHTKLSSRSSPHTGAHLQIGHRPAQAQSAADAKNAAHS